MTASAESTSERDPDSVPEIARRLRQLRMAMASSQAEFCRQYGFPAQTWNTYETGYGRISLDAALALSRELGVSLDWIYTGVWARPLPQKLLGKLREIEPAEEAAPTFLDLYEDHAGPR